ncbi:MAG: aspartyl protease family protein [Candidatus Eremiobacteraeota bacterium]|nr:aspartyl protease family protein [Candidatus Eremiobacteraeota bacterium]
MDRRFVFAMLYLCFAITMAPAMADDGMTVAQIREHIRIAEGPPLANYRETGDTVLPATRKHAVIAYLQDDYRETVTEGPVTTSSGEYHEKRWHQNANGELLPDAPDPTNAEGGIVVTTSRRITEPIDGYLLSSLDPLGRGTKRYVAAGSWNVVREDRIRAATTTITTYDDFRKVAGHTFAFHVTSKDGRPEDDEDVRLADVSVGGVTDADVTIPMPSRQLVEFPAGKTVVQLPAREDHGKFVVRVQIGGRGLDMLIDSGASGIILEEGVAQELGLAKFGTETNDYNAGSFQESSAIVPLMRVGDLTMKNVVVSTAPKIDEPSDMRDFRIVGLLGFDFIDAMALKLDYYDGTATAFAPGAFVPPATGDGFATDLRLGDGAPLVSLDVNGATGDRFLIDTGGYGSLLFFDRFARRHPAAMRDEGGGGEYKRNIRLLGIGGEVATKPYQFARVALGGVTFHDYLGFLITQRGAYDDGTDGALGPDLLHLFDLTFDYANSKAYFYFHQ